MEHQELTAVFCDYECLYWGMDNFGELPDLEAFILKIKEKGRLDSIYFFGDFTERNMQAELPRLRTITSNIIDCATGEPERERKRKSFTDFIMLDNIYWIAFQRQDISQFIIATGDGHFNSVVAYLKTFLNKTVGVCGVQGTVSNQLKQAASWFFEIAPKENTYFEEILNNLKWAEDNNLTPTFMRTVEATAQHYNIKDTKKLAQQLSSLIKENLVVQTVVPAGESAKARILIPDWDLIEQRGLLKRA